MTTPTRRALRGPRALACLVCAVAALAGGCRKPPPADKPPGPLPVNSFTRAWGGDAQVPKRDALAALHVRDDTVYAVTRAGTVSGLKRDSGQLQFTYAIKGGSQTLFPPVVLKDEVVYPTATTLEVYKRDGRFTRSVPLPFAVRTAAAGVGSTVFLAGDYPQGGARVVKIDLTQPYVPIGWEFLGLNGGRSGYTSGLQVVEDAVYAAGLDGYVYAVLVRSREKIWPIPDGVFKTGGAIEADLAADATGVYVASTDSVLYALNRNSGKLRWQYFAGVPLREAPVVTSDRVYIKVPGKGLVVFDKILATPSQFREPLWTSPDAQQFLAQDERFSYLRGKDNRVVAVDKKTGEAKFQTKRKDFAVFGTNTKDDGLVFVASTAGNVIAIRSVTKPGVIGVQVRNDGAAADDWEPVAVAAR